MNSMAACVYVFDCLDGFYAEGFVMFLATAAGCAALIAGIYFLAKKFL